MASDASLVMTPQDKYETPEKYCTPAGQRSGACTERKEGACWKTHLQVFAPGNIVCTDVASLRVSFREAPGRSERNAAKSSSANISRSMATVGGDQVAEADRGQGYGR